ncbi:guanine(37)-N1-methyltransferase [Geopyxis carbonaria]|nr:guanine(37)-N1-methyltransferase [Geopyxis carbonaria]
MPPQKIDTMSRLFLPPVNRSMTSLDRTFFRKIIPLSAARIFDKKNIGRVRKDCAKDILRLQKVDSLVEDRIDGVRKVLLLQPKVKHNDNSTISLAMQDLIESKILELIPYELNMNYDHWNYDEIIHSILPEELLDEVPGSFTQAGHIAHVNLRNTYLPYKYIIAQIILDKNPQIKTVVNKIEDVGADSIFRTFPMEILQGIRNTIVEVKEGGCIFQFDFAKVYWNTRLGHEHERIVNKFKPGEAIADVMAGVGPFALPAGKKECFVWANDLNPESFASLQQNIKRNKVNHFVSAHNQDGRQFIRESIQSLYKVHRSSTSNPVVIPAPPPKHRNRTSHSSEVSERRIPVPATFSQFVMNLPGSAVEFLDAFIGSYQGLENIFMDGTNSLPTIHLYTFHRELPGKTEKDAPGDICSEISKHMRYKMNPSDVVIENVRRVAPAKVMYCASFTLPGAVAFSNEKEQPI